MNRLTLPGRTSIFFSAGFTVLAAFCMFAAPEVHASPIPLQRVQVGDLDLATPQGLRNLNRRIDAAINTVCVKPNSNLPRTRAVVEGIDACRAAARASVRHQLADLGIRPEMRAVQSR